MNQTLITWDRAHAPLLFAAAAAQPRILYLQDLFEGTPTVDEAYQYYCDRNADAPVQNNVVLRNLQMQQRTYALAGVMSKRFDPDTVYAYDSFKDNMRLTAHENKHPMDMDHTVRTMAMLDSRRGRGSYSDYIRVPQAQRSGLQRPFTDFLPVYNDTWDAFLDNACDPRRQAMMRLPALSIT